MMTKYNLVQFGSRTAKLPESAPPPPQVENVLNRPGEIGLNKSQKPQVMFYFPEIK